MSAEPELLARLSENVTAIVQTLANTEFAWGVTYEGPAAIANTSFAVSDAANHNLGIAPAVLATSYMWQLPKLKAPGSLFFSVLIADLVLLQTLWTIFKLVVDTYWIEKRAELRRCEGCEMREQRGGDVSLERPRGKSEVGVTSYEMLR